MTEDDTNALRAIVRQESAAAGQRIIEATAANLSDLRGELITRLDRLERRTERVETNTNALLMQVAGIS